MSETADKNTIAGAFGSGVFALRHIELLYYSDLFLSTVFSRFFSSFFFCVLFFPTSADLVFFREHCRGSLTLQNPQSLVWLYFFVKFYVYFCSYL
jgi:hypothetical protein